MTPLTVGLTGGIGSGKSTVGRMMQSLGARVIDADNIAHQIYDTEPRLTADLAAHFGSEILDPHGKVDRKRLAEIVFADPVKRKDLEAILHPRIRAKIQERINEAGSQNPPLIVVEAALMVETGYSKAFDGLIVVKAKEEQQLRRIQKRDGSSEEEVMKRMAAQAALDEKLKVATWIVDNSGDLKETQAQVEALYQKLTAP